MYAAKHFFPTTAQITRMLVLEVRNLRLTLNELRRVYVSSQLANLRWSWSHSSDGWEIPCLQHLGFFFQLLIGLHQAKLELDSSSNVHLSFFQAYAKLWSSFLQTSLNTMLQKLTKCEIKAWICFNLIIENWQKIDLSLKKDILN